MCNLITIAPYVPLLQTIAWILLIAIFLCVFYRRLTHLFDTIILRIRKGSSFKAGPVEIGADLRQLDYAPPGEDKIGSKKVEEDWAPKRTLVYQKNKGIFLTHVISPSKVPGQKYDVFIYLIRHKTTDFSDVARASFFFGHMWGNRVFEEDEKDGIIGVRTSAYGPFLCTCRVYFKDGSSIELSRYIDFEMGRAFQKSLS